MIETTKTQPLCDLKGKVIGVCTTVYLTNEKTGEVVRESNFLTKIYE